MNFSQWLHQLFAIGTDEKPAMDQIKKEPLRQVEAQKLYQRPDSFTQYLPWIEFQEESKTVLLDDGISVGAVFDVVPLATEGRSYDWLSQKRDAILNAFQDTFEDFADSPWIVQQFTYDEDCLDEYVETLKQYIDPAIRDTQHTQTWLQIMEQHLKGVCKEDGLFEDNVVLEGPWRGKRRRTKLIIYRRLTEKQAAQLPWSAEESLNDVASRFEIALKNASVTLIRNTGPMVYRFLLDWFNPSPWVTDGDRRAFRDAMPYIGAEDLPYGDDLAESLFIDQPRSDATSQTWWFNDKPHRCIRIHKLRQAPRVGQVSGEMTASSMDEAKTGKAQCMLDQLPPGSIFASTMVITNDEKVKKHIQYLNGKAKGDGVDAKITREDCETASSILGRRHKLFYAMAGVYIRGDNMADLRVKSNKVSSILLANQCVPVKEDDESLGLDAYIFQLPMVYEPSMDRKFKAMRLNWVQHLANLSFFFGRHRGTGHCGSTNFNRGGEPLDFDPFHKDGRKQNAHGLVLGSTGSGKSGYLCNFSAQIMAVHRPRLFIVEVGNSFGVLAQYFASQGLKVNKVTITPKSNVSLPPFAEAWRLLDGSEEDLIGSKIVSDTPIISEHDIEKRLPARAIYKKVEMSFRELPPSEQQRYRDIASQDIIAGMHLAETDIEEETPNGSQDVMGEMEIIATLMITGGEEQEMKALSRADRRLIRDAILRGARHAVSESRMTLTEDIAKGFYSLSKDDTYPDYRRQRAFEMGEALKLFCDGFEGHVFNREGTTWPDADVTIIDLGTFAREGYSAQLSIAYTSIMMHINNMAEHYQHDARQIVMITDEGHVVTTNPLLSPFVVKIVKMWRKLGAWWWVATQNMDDFPDSAQKMLNMIEWWVCLSMPPEEVAAVSRFRTMTSEQRQLTLSINKEPGKYAEGVVFSKTIEALFRSVPPSVFLSLAGTEKHEKDERKERMTRYGISDLEAALLIAQELDYKRGIGPAPITPSTHKAQQETVC